MIAPRLLCLLTLALVPVGAWADPAPWHLPGAAARFVIDLDNPPPGTKPNAPAPPVAWTRFGLPDPSWADAPVRAYDPNGNPVGVKLLWSAPGEPPSWAFDSSSGAKRYFLYVGLPSSSKVFVAPDPLAGWNPEAGALLETRSYDGREVGRVEDFRTLWDKNPVPLGRSLLATVFEGGHRHGPQQNLLSVYHAWFDAPADATYQFATISADASFLLVDGKPVTAWPGRHWWGPGVQGQYHGSIDLTAGPHQLEYDNAYTFRSDGRPPLLCCIAAKAGDGGWAMLRAETAFFRPIRHAHLADYETAPDADTEIGRAHV